MISSSQNTKDKNVEAIYPLSPMQEGMLFHTLYDTESDVYFEQFSFEIKSQLNLNAFRQAWQTIVDRHPVLRTLFLWEKRSQPLQVVRKKVELPWTFYDWQSWSEEEQSQQFEDLLKQDRKQGFDLKQAPLMRCILIQLSSQSYYFIWSSHHILFDGWCLPILLQEVLSFYESYCQQQTLSLPQPRPYRDYIAWLQKQDLDKAKAFWQDKLQGFTAPTPLVIDSLFNSSKDDRNLYQEQSLTLSSELTEKLNQIARKNHITLNTIVQGAWGVLLSRYSGGSDVIFGATVSGRPPELTGVESMVGLFINTLPVRVQIPEDDTVISWLQSLRAQQVECEQYSYTPLVEIQRWSNIPKGTPLFDSIIVFENYPVDEFLEESTKGLGIDLLKSFEQTNYPLYLIIAPGLEFELKIAYNINLYKDVIIRRLLGHLQVLLEEMVTNPQRKVSQLPLLTEAEKDQILEEWNNTQAEYPKDKCIHQLFEEQVERTPNAIAVAFGEQSLNYQQLNEKGNQLAHYLQTLGVTSNVAVGICLERSLEMVIGLLGILKAGGAYVPLDPTYPEQRLSYMLSNSQASVIITTESLLCQLPELQAQKVKIDEDWARISQFSSKNCNSQVQPEDLAYIIYTSGSTGQPKGVAMGHRPLVNLINWQNQHTAVTDTEKTLQFAPISFDVSFQEIFSTWCMGGQLILVSDTLRKDPKGLITYIKKQKIARLFVPFVALQQLAEMACQTQQFPVTLKEIITAGEQLRITPSIAQLFQQLPQSRLHNHYGPSESHVVTAYTLSEDIETWPVLPSIGQPISNVKIHILDQNLCAVPSGVLGELHIGGVGLAQGYINRPDLTAEKFISNPFDPTGKTKLYKTGDLCRYLPDGNIEYIGRIDHQVKIRGFRIELGEIEALLSSHPDIRENVVITQEDNGNKRLIAYIVSPQEQITATLREYLKAKLPEYMIPSAFILLEKLPLTPNGKIDRKALPSPDFSNRQQDFIPPITPSQQILASIWQSTLKTGQISLSDNFFELGGHSLLATQIISRIRETFSLDLPIRSLFEHPTLEQLSQQIDNSQKTDISPILPLENRENLPLSYAQQRLWFLDQLEGENATYNIPLSLNLQGNLNLNALENSLNQIIERHESLRTRLMTIEGEPRQIIDPEAKINLETINLEHLSTEEKKQQSQALINTEALTPFNLSEDRLIRAKLIKLNKNHHILLMTLHHIISDGWSMGIFVQELSQHYTADHQGKDLKLDPLPIQYADFAAWQKEYLSGENLQQQINYWKEKLSELPPLLELPTDHPRPPVQTFKGSNINFNLTQELSQKLQQMSQENGVTLFMTLLSAFSILLSRYSRQEDIAIGSPIANRNRKETESLIGFFVNTLVLRINLENHPTVKELLKQVRSTSLEAYNHQDIPFEKIVEEINPERNMSHSPLFQVMFVLQNAPMEDLSLPELSLSPVEMEYNIAKFDLTLSMEESEEGLRGSWEYNTDLFERETLLRMIGHFQVLLEGMVNNPEEKVTLLSLLTEAEKQQILVEWNETEAEYPKDKCIHQLFEEQVLKTPEAVAVVYEGQQLTYEQLNQKANQLGHYLVKLGVKPDTLVGICVERSLEMIVGLLGILKAGGAYVPIDPNYPQERIEYMIEDSGVSVLLTQEKLIESLPETKANLISLDKDWIEIEIEIESKMNVEREVSSNNLAYVIYTSGSTGQPKGVMIQHCAISNHMLWMQDTFPLTSEDKVLQKTPFSFDASVWEFYAPLLVGGQLVMAKPEAHRDPHYLIKIINQQTITILQLVPSLLRLLLEDPNISTCRSLKRVFCGGEALTGELWSKFKGCFKASLHNLYGPTECCIDTNFYTCHEVLKSTTIPIGKPVKNTQSYVLDVHLKPVPIGVLGELHIGGIQVGKGYLNKPELTAEKFIPNPFDPIKHTKLYKTGDLCRYLPDGNIEYIGRIDHQVKIRGFRIELGEIESLLSSHPDIRENVVIAQEDNGNKRLIAYLVSEQDNITSSLREYLKEKLPEYMIPSAFILLEKLPLTPNGKIDRKALPTPDWSGRLHKNFIAPQSELEIQLANIWQEVLMLNMVGVTDNFFELGGHSLIATQVMSRIRERFSVEISLRLLFEYPTISQLAKSIERLYLAKAIQESSDVSTEVSDREEIEI